MFGVLHLANHQKRTLAAISVMLFVLPFLTGLKRVQKSHSNTVPIPLSAEVRSLSIYLRQIGYPLPPAVGKALNLAARQRDPAQADRAFQKALDPFCLIHIHINPEARVGVEPGKAAPELAQNRWRLFLVKVNNEAGVTAPLRVQSHNLVVASRQKAIQRQRWMQLGLSKVPEETSSKTALSSPAPLLSGARVQYMILLLSSAEKGKREATLGFDIGQGTQDLGFRSEVSLLFRIIPALPPSFGS